MKKKKLKKIIKKLDNGKITLNRAREELGLPPVQPEFDDKLSREVTKIYVIERLKNE